MESMNADKNRNPNITKEQDSALCMEYRTVIFIRHGHSIWNESTDNSFTNPYSAAKAISAFTWGVKEYAKLKWSSEYKHEDSIYVDTPLSPKGMKQAYNLSSFLKHHEELRDEQKLLYLQQHQTISSSIKDAWRALQQFKLEQQLQHSLCDDALLSLTKAMKSVESLMANAKPLDPEDYIINHDVPIDIASILDILIGKNMKSIIVCSNLRRAISTCVLSLWNRLRSNTTEKIYILSCLQEIGINPDTHTHTSQFQVPHVSNFEMMHEHLDAKALNDFYSKRIETVYNYGNKMEYELQQDTLKRMESFAKWIFMQGNEEIQTEHPVKEKANVVRGFKTVKKKAKIETQPAAVIAVGHSAYIRSFFTQYLPAKCEFIGKTKKLSNCGVVAFKMWYCSKTQTFGIAPNTITVVYKGFGLS
eukprot:279569_1